MLLDARTWFGRTKFASYPELLERRFATPVLLIALTALSLYLRTRILGAGYWIDEGLSVGIAHHHWT
ncbi:MAG TPA: hypothetical protein VGH52_09395, partial [Gaiellaceae bacterium]